jgi:hypothetical protein
MLVKMSAEQVSNYWPSIRDTLQAAVPPLAKADKEHMNFLLEKLLRSDEMFAWILCENQGEGEDTQTKIYAMLITVIDRDLGTGARSLLIYALYSYIFVKEHLWVQAINTLKHHAREMGCFQITAFTKVPRVVTIAQDLGFTTGMQLLTLEV